MSDLRKKIGLVGAGNMGSSILEGILKTRLAPAEQLWVYDKEAPKAKAFAMQWEVNEAKDAASLFASTDVVILAIKPQDLAAFALETAKSIKKKHILISILAGVPLSRFEELWKENPLVVRAMPNLGAKVGNSMTAITGAEENSLDIAEQIFSGCGKTIRLEESFFDLVTAVSGSGPAYFFLMMEALAEAAKAHGLDETTAELLAVQTALGASQMASLRDAPCAELRKRVTSKGGTTEAALKVLDGQDFKGMMKKAIDAAVKRGRELSQS